MSNHPTRSLMIDAPFLSESGGQRGDSSADLNPFQRAEFGLDFEFARDLAERQGIDLGEGVTVVHFDEGWRLDHPYFDSFLSRSRSIEQLGPTTRRNGRAGHGTSVLGLHIGGFDGDLDIAPLLPGVSVVLANALDTEGVTSSEVLSGAIDLLAGSRSGVLLIARDWSSRAPHLPYELRSGVAELIEHATRLGIVVVQAAGNGGLCLDNLVRREGPSVQGQITMRSDPWIGEADRTGPAFRIETGSLIVGASTATLPFRRWTAGFVLNPQPKSNYGRRVDCCAPGEQLFTAAEPGSDGRSAYTSSFGGTSGAAAIVAAAVAAVQSLVINATGAHLSAKAVRSLFRNAELGSPILGCNDPIGSVPNIRRILERILGTRTSS